jgi:alpha-soluble NSF attachment protein
MFAAVFGGNKYEDAAELLEKACNNYKLAKMWREAASGFELLADCHLKSDSKHDAASAMVDAANANKKVNVDAAVANLRKAVEYFNDLGRLSIAAKHLKDIGDVCEKEGKMEEALRAYTEAGDLYAGEESSSTANACMLKVAEISATLGDYRAAVDKFEAVGKESMGNNLLRFSVKGYLLNAGVCRLVLSERGRGEASAGEVRRHRPLVRGEPGVYAAERTHGRG